VTSKLAAVVKLLNLNSGVFQFSIGHDTECTYRGADKSLARPTSQCILFDGENISFDASLVIYINSTNFSPIMIMNRMCEHHENISFDASLVIYINSTNISSIIIINTIYEHQNLLSL
jgi:homoserine trans-succinylase